MNNFKRKVFFISWLTIVGLIFSFSVLPLKADAATPVYKYEWVAQSGNVSKDGLAHEYTNLQSGQTINLSLTMINRSGKTIQAKSKLNQSPDKQVPVGSWGIGSQTPFQDGTPSFLDSSSFVLNNNRFVYYDGERSMHSNGDTPNGWMINFSWNIKLKDNLADGVYKLYVLPVCEYLAWTRQVKNGQLLPTTSSDIYWKFRVGGGDDSDVPAGYVRYVNPKYGFSFVYKEPVYPEVLAVDDAPVDALAQLALSVRLGAIEGGNPFAYVWVYKNTNLSQAINGMEAMLKGSGNEFVYTRSNLERNGVNWTVFNYETRDYPGNPYGEIRVGQLPSGYILRVYFSANLRPQIDQMLLDSVKPITTSSTEVLTYSSSGTDFVFDYPNNWEITRNLNFPFSDRTGVIALLALREKGTFDPGGEPITVNLYANSGRSINSAIDWYIQHQQSYNSAWAIKYVSTTLKTTNGNNYKQIIYGIGNVEIYSFFVINEFGFVIQVDVSSYNNNEVAKSASVIFNSIR